MTSKKRGAPKKVTMVEPRPEVVQTREDLDADQKKENVETALSQMRQGLEILQGALDWCDQHEVRVFWVHRRRTKVVNLRVADLKVEVESPCGISGLLEAIETMKGRLSRRAERHRNG